jgi:hypothetical protein
MFMPSDNACGIINGGYMSVQSFLLPFCFSLLSSGFALIQLKLKVVLLFFFSIIVLILLIIFICFESFFYWFLINLIPYHLVLFDFYMKYCPIVLYLFLNWIYFSISSFIILSHFIFISNLVLILLIASSFFGFDPFLKLILFF